MDSHHPVTRPHVRSVSRFCSGKTVLNRRTLNISRLNLPAQDRQYHGTSKPPSPQAEKPTTTSVDRASTSDVSIATVIERQDPVVGGVSSCGEVRRHFTSFTSPAGELHQRHVPLDINVVRFVQQERRHPLTINIFRKTVIIRQRHVHL